MMFSPRFVFQFLCVAAVVDGGTFFVNEKDVIKNMDPLCPTVNHYTAAYHQDTACNRAQQNTFKGSLDRFTTHARLTASGTDSVPSERTSFCPQTVVPLTNSEANMGFDTAWIVENTATTPIVVAFMLQLADGSFREVSAFDNKISPPNHDPKAILQPEQWRSLQTFEGHVFHVREVLKDGAMGRVLMQHRVGLIPVTNKYGHELACDPTDPDVEPVVEVAPGDFDRNPNFAREAPREMRPCNVLDIGFRNEVGCPLNAYYSGMYQLKGTAKPRGNLRPMDQAAAAKEQEAEVDFQGHTAMSCHEVFKFHLGLKEKSDINFMFDWNSKTKYEGTYVGHNFVFRLAKDERIVVDSVALHPTKVIDCPGLKNQVSALSYGEGVAIMDPVLQRLGADNLLMLSSKFLNANATASAAAGGSATNATEWARSTVGDLPSPSATRRRRRALASSGRGAAAGMSTHSS